MKNKKAFTFIELMIVVGIIALLATVILVSVNRSRINARINGTKTSLKSALPSVIACKDGGGTVNQPTDGVDICTTGAGLSGSKWPTLSYGYTYIPGGSYNRVDCVFEVKLDDAKKLTCSCITQICRLI